MAKSAIIAKRRTADREVMFTLTDEVKAELKAKYKRLELYEDEVAGDIVFRPATQEAWDRFLDEVDNSNVADPSRTLIDSCVVFPPVEQLSRLHTELPALADTLTNLIRKASGGRKDPTSSPL